MISYLKQYKMWLHVLLRGFQDALSAHRFCKRRSQPSLPYSLRLEQPFTASATLNEKKHNLRLAADRIRQYVVNPGDVFSFWRTVGNPNTSQFEASRSIRGGELQLERGGGLCQASGIIHHLALVAGLQVVERHNHSKDLYTEATRFCPLGSDATVAFGYRDLRVQNTTSTPIVFDLQVCDDHFEAFLRSADPITAHDIRFEQSEEPDGSLKALAIDAPTGRTLCTSRYERI